MTRKTAIGWPSVAVASATQRVGTPSSSTIVACPWPSAIAALTAPLRSTKKVSSASTTVSPFTVRVMGCDVVPRRKVRTPLAAT